MSWVFKEIVEVGLALFRLIITIPLRKSSEGPQPTLHHTQYSNSPETNMHVYKIHVCKILSPGSFLHLNCLLSSDFHIHAYSDLTIQLIGFLSCWASPILLLLPTLPFIWPVFSSFYFSMNISEETYSTTWLML